VHRNEISAKSFKFEEEIRMRMVKTVLVVLALSLLGILMAPQARADGWNKKTIMTFDQPVEIPGQVLPAGTYTFQLFNSLSDRHIVQVFNADGTQILATILAIPNYRLTPSGGTVVKFSERAGDNPDALKAWFNPGDNFGQEFVYPKQRAIQLAQATHEVIPALATEVSAPEQLATTPIVAVTPEAKEVPVAEVIQTTPPAAAPAPVAAATPAPAPAAEEPVLPKTASSMPLIALLGLASLGLALGLKLFTK
jgi:hypothetical protein